MGCRRPGLPASGLGLLPFPPQILAAALTECHRKSSAQGKPLGLKVFVAGRNRLENDGATALAEAFGVSGFCTPCPAVPRGSRAGAHPALELRCETQGELLPAPRRLLAHSAAGHNSRHVSENLHDPPLQVPWWRLPGVLFEKM